MIELSTHGSIRFIRLNAPPVNALSAPLRARLLSSLNDAFNDADVDLVVLGSQLPLFCAGADIQEFRAGEMWTTPDLPTICTALDNAPKLTLAAINGTAMGGALELALGCDYRIASVGVSVGLPEVSLGLVPGAGGTQRLPRLVNVDLATRMIVTGKPVSAEEAFDAGLLDKLVASSDRFDEAVLQYAHELLESGSLRKPCADRSVDMSSVTKTFFSEQQDALEKKSRGQVAPLKGLQLIETASRHELDAGLERERRVFDELLDTPQANAMIHLFLAEKETRQVPGVTQATSMRSIGSTAVVGAGTMGTGISITLLDAGFPVILLDKTAAALDLGVAAIKTHYQRALDKQRINPAAISDRLARLDVSLDLQAISTVDLVIEAVFESYAAKLPLFRQLDQLCKPGAILASNTSTLDLDQIAAVTTRPDDVIGLHFFSPANLMRLLEIVRGNKTAADVVKTAQHLGRKIKKVPVVVNVCYGFVGNRMLEPYFREASRLMLEGATAMQIDRVLTDFGMAMGVISMGDLAGIDVGYRVRESRRAVINCDPGYQAIQDTLYALGRYGQKTGRGVYKYQGRDRIDDPEVIQLCSSLAAELNIAQREITDTEVLERCLYPLINEGFLILEEGIAHRSGDCDVVWVNGYGFPAARGGPMHYASEIGHDRVLHGMENYRQALGDYGEMWFSPARSLREAAVPA